MNGLTFEKAYDALAQLIGETASSFLFLMDSDQLSENEKEQYRGMTNIQDGKYHMNHGVILSSLKVLSQLLSRHYGKNTIFIIDEYDVPLDKAFESIFTGINNFKVLSILDSRYDEQLIAGEAIEKEVHLELTYNEIEKNIDNIWSVLFTTGYLTKAGEVKLPDRESYALKLVIPNKEVREIFIVQIQEWFKETVAKDHNAIRVLSEAILEADTGNIQKQLNIIMDHMISILDTKAPDRQKENFYHGLLLGLLRGSNPNWRIQSNRESGDGFSDIMIKPEDPDSGIVIEVKYARSFGSLDQCCDDAVEQINTRRYDAALREEGRCNIIKYGIAFHKKRCKVVAWN